MNELNNTRKNIKYYVNYDTHKKTKTKYNLHATKTHMFLEDFSRLVPYKVNKDELKIELKNKSKEQISTICQGFESQSRYYHADIEDTFRGFINEVARSVIMFDEAYYEIVYFFEDDSNKPSSFALEKVMYEDISIKNKNAIIRIPKNIAREKEIKHKYKICLDNLIIFNYPNILGGKKSLNKILIHLTELSNMGLSLEALKNNDFGFDHEAYYYKSDLLLAKSTDNLKWDGRNSFDKRMTEYYKWYRLIEYKKAQRIFLDSIVSKINSVLYILNQKIEINSHLEIKGIPTIGEYNQLKYDLKNGNISFMNLVNKIL